MVEMTNLKGVFALIPTRLTPALINFGREAQHLLGIFFYGYMLAQFAPLLI